MNERSAWIRGITGPRGRWITLAVWIAAAALLSMLLPSVNGEETGNAPDLDGSKPSVQAAAVAGREFASGADLPALLVWHRDGGLTDADLQGVQRLYGKWAEEPVQHQTYVPPLKELPLQALKAELSEDGSTLVSPVLFDGEADADALKQGVDKLKDDAADAFGGDPFAAPTDAADRLSARVTGPVGIQIDATGLFKNADFALLLATVLLVLVLLLLIYRSPISAFIPLVAVGFAYGVAGPILGWMAREGWITVDAQGISIMTVLLFGAGTDYCLFLITRFRQLLKTEESKPAALRAAISGSAGAIAMSGFTVVLALLALLLAEFGSYRRFAVPFSLAIFVMGIASLTLVPALLAIFGRSSFWPAVPRTPDRQVDRAARRGQPVPAKVMPARSMVGSLVTRRPLAIVVASVVVLGALAAAATQIKFTFDILSSFPATMESREGFALIGEKFSPGELAPVQVIVDTQGQDVSGLAQALQAESYVERVGEPVQGSQHANVVKYDVQLAMNPYSIEAMDRLPDLRRAAESSLRQAGVADAANRVWIGGQTAEQFDNRAAGERDTRVILPVVIALIAALLLLYLRSVVATVYLVLTVILSYFSALGLGWLVLHEAMGAEAIQGAIPLYSFVFLVALGEDYNIFMISSIWHKSKRMPLKDAIREGVGDTGAVITSAGLILAGTFAVLASLPIQALVQFGVITAIGVLLDTFVVRPFLVPAITVLLGRFAFWPAKRSEDPQPQPKGAIPR